MSEYIYVIGVDGDPQMPTKRKRYVEQLLQTEGRLSNIVYPVWRISEEHASSGRSLLQYS